MAFTLPFTSVGGDPAGGIGVSIDLGSFSVTSDKFSIPTHNCNVTVGMYNTYTWPQARYGGTGWIQYYILIDGTRRATVYFDQTKVTVGTLASTKSWAKLSKSRSVTTSSAINTSLVFNENNPTDLRVPMTVQRYEIGAHADVGGNTKTVTALLSGTEYVTLDVPPTFNNDPIAYDTNFADPYAGLTTASVDIDTLTAYYGGYITRATLTIGNQSDELTGDDQDILSSGTLSILLGSVGTFTPTITVEDSRGQTATVTLADITVKGYSAPQVVVNELIRTDKNGTANDEGECAVVTATLTWTSAITNLTAPTVVAKELDDTLVSTTTTWYTDRALQNAISDWSAVSNMPIYGFIGNSNTPPNPFDTQDSYNITITPNDGEGSGTPVTNTLGSAFYTVDFLAGGHGIAFGKPAEIPNLFDVAIPTRFNDYVQYRGGQFTLRGIFVDTQEPTSTDGEDGDIWLVYEE